MGSLFSLYPDFDKYVVGHTYGDPEYWESTHTKTLKNARKLIGDIRFLETQLHIDEFCDCKISRCTRDLVGLLSRVPPSYRKQEDFIKVAKEAGEVGVKVPEPTRYAIVRN